MRKIYIAGLILFLNFTLFAKDSKIDKILPHTTLFYNLHGNEGIRKYINIVNSDLRRRLPSLRYIDLLPYKNMKKELIKKGKNPFCSDLQTAIEQGKILKKDRVLYGYITKTTKKISEKLGTEGGKKYVVERKEKETFQITVILVDVNNKKEIKTFVENSSDLRVYSSISILLKRIQKYYKGKRVEEKISPKLKTHLTLTGSYLQPFGTFSDLVSSGYGAGLSFGVSDFIIPFTVIQVSASGYLLSPKQDNIDFFYMYHFSVEGGFKFSLGQVDIIPMVGIGRKIDYMNSDIDGINSNGQYDYSTRLYSDPTLLLKCELDYNFSNGYAVVLSSEYVSFVEEERTGKYININFGVKKNF